MGIRKGRVLFFNGSYGFIRDTVTGVDLYVNYKDIIEKESGQYKYLNRGEIVSYIKYYRSNKAVDISIIIEKTEKGKDIIPVKIFSVKSDINLNHMYSKIKYEFGFRNIYSVDNILIASNSVLKEIEVNKICDNFKSNKIKNPLQFKDKIIYFN